MTTPREAIDAWLDGDADEAQVEALALWLRDDPEHRRCFARMAALERAIRDANAPTAEPVAMAASAPSSQPSTSQRGSRTSQRITRQSNRHRIRTSSAAWRTGMIAAVLLVVAIGLVWRTPTRISTPPADQARNEIAPATPKDERPTLASVDGEVRILGQANAPRSGTALTAGSRLVVGSPGLAKVRYPDGTTVELLAGSEAIVVALAPKRLDLVRGSLQAQVAKQPIGSPLVIATKLADAVVRGTSLRLDADDAATALTVRTGLVTLRRPGGESVDVPAGRWAMADASALRSRPIGESIFVMGIDLNGTEPVTIDGERWRTAAEAARGGLTFLEPPLLWNGDFAPPPTMDRQLLNMLDSTVYAKERLALVQTLPPGRYRVHLWTVENRGAGVRSFSITIEGAQRAEGVGRDHVPSQSYRLGPFDVDVTDGALDLLAVPDTVLQRNHFNHPHFSGLTIERLPAP